MTELILKNCTCREFAFFLFKNSKVDVRIGTKICCRKSVVVCQSNNERDKKNLLITSGALITLIADVITDLFSCGHIALECNKSQQFSHATKGIVCLVVLQFFFSSPQYRTYYIISWSFDRIHKWIPLFHVFFFQLLSITKRRLFLITCKEMSLQTFNDFYRAGKPYFVLRVTTKFLQEIIFHIHTKRNNGGHLWIRRVQILSFGQL